MYSTFILLLIAFSLPGLQSQCYQCDNYWHARCNVSTTGYYCTEGTKMSLLPNVDLPTTKWEACAPAGRHIDYVEDYCCIYSPEKGCTLALRPSLYETDPGENCMKCELRCNCARDASTMLQPWRWWKILTVLMFSSLKVYIPYQLVSIY